MSLPSSLNTITLDIQPDKVLLLYPFVLLLISVCSLYLANINLWLKLFIFCCCLVMILFLCVKYIFLQRAQSVITIEFKQAWYLHYQDTSIEEATLNAGTVYTPFMLFLLFNVNGKAKRVIIRRKAVDANQYDALYVYLKHILPTTI